MEPLLGKTALEFAVDRATELLEQAKSRREEELARCTSYLEAALAAIEGLEREYDEILVDARNVGDDIIRTADLQRRIDSYLTVDRLRPRLHDAIAGLDLYCQQFQVAAHRFFQWPWKRQDRVQASRDFTALLVSLRDYLDRLDKKGLQHRPAGTGVGIDVLMVIRKTLRTPPSLRSAGPEEIARPYQESHDKEPRFEQIRRIRVVAEKIRKAFT
jgi:hypothetical protein